jgi:hypothetical protein
MFRGDFLSSKSIVMQHFLRFFSILACWMMPVINHRSRFMAPACRPMTNLSGDDHA